MSQNPLSNSQDNGHTNVSQPLDFVTTMQQTGVSWTPHADAWKNLDHISSGINPSDHLPPVTELINQK